LKIQLEQRASSRSRGVQQFFFWSGACPTTAHELRKPEVFDVSQWSKNRETVGVALRCTHYFSSDKGERLVKIGSLPQPQMRGAQ